MLLHWKSKTAKIRGQGDLADYVILDDSTNSLTLNSLNY